MQVMRNEGVYVYFISTYRMALHRHLRRVELIHTRIGFPLE